MPRGVYNHWKVRGRPNPTASQRMRDLWNIPEVRERRVKSCRIYMNTPEYKQKMSAKMKEVWARVGYREKAKQRQTHQLVNVFTHSPSPDLSYILGTYYGDASVYKTGQQYPGYLIQLRAKDKDFVEEFAKSIGHIITRRPPPPVSLKEKEQVWVTYLVSKDLYSFLKQPLEDHMPFIESYPEPFLRGFADSEGCVSGGKTELLIYNTDLNLLGYVSKLLQKLGIPNKLLVENRIDSNRKPLGRLYIHRFGFQTFAHAIGFSIARKSLRLAEWIDHHKFYNIRNDYHSTTHKQPLNLRLRDEK